MGWKDKIQLKNKHKLFSLPRNGENEFSRDINERIGNLLLEDVLSSLARILAPESASTELLEASSVLTLLLWCLSMRFGAQGGNWVSRACPPIGTGCPGNGADSPDIVPAVVAVVVGFVVGAVIVDVDDEEDDGDDDDDVVVDNDDGA